MLSKCYRNALKVAAAHEFKHVAFPLLGAGGRGYPVAEAASHALQAVRRFLENHREHTFERIR